ncbi:Zn-ribbon domain-containing OB-fold protein [Streptacidiphilus carbonis]|uniref:Zn-ribbon domain-containing OB-fold protein n=1 Tax=Streptacidiphilus carbonis TaxID=105422 RepID=UPI0005A95174|nr:OB-fold domain-containing protein [Streptacidiphilus carbonis]
MRTRTPALGAEGWFTEDGGPALVGSRCDGCAAVAFPAASFRCPNPACGGSEFTEVRLGPGGTVWSYTDLRYQPPAPFVPALEPYEPCTLVAVEVDGSGLVVLGQAVAGVSVEDLRVGARVELVVDTLFCDDEHEYTIWKWRPAGVAR